jgi:hypothetical protein
VLGFRRHVLARELQRVRMASWCGANRRRTPARAATRRNSVRTAAPDQDPPAPLAEVVCTESEGLPPLMSLSQDIIDRLDERP